jgi:glycosyltransferase involved in cell wall biosynthesis
MIHTMHLEPPYTPDAPLNALWSRWFAISDRFDAVVWPTGAQRDAVVTRFGEAARNLVAPNGVTLPGPGSEPAGLQREPGLVVSMSRLAAGKRIDHSIRAFVAAGVPGTRFEIWGDGPERARIAELIDELGVGDRVALCGSTTAPAAVFARASLFVTATAFEGQGLSIVEALASGVPAVSYDVRFGPGDILAGGAVARAQDAADRREGAGPPGRRGARIGGGLE